MFDPFGTRKRREELIAPYVRSSDNAQTKKAIYLALTKKDFGNGDTGVDILKKELGKDELSVKCMLLKLHERGVAPATSACESMGWLNDKPDMDEQKQKDGKKKVSVGKIIRKILFWWGVAIIAIVFGNLFYETVFKPNQEGFIGGGILVLIIALIILCIWFFGGLSRQCPKCKKFWAVKQVDSEDLGVASNAYTRVENGKLHTFERHNVRYTYECSSCGHVYQKTLWKEIQLS